MATWRDGAAYAPETRPDGFASPAADPLPEGEPYRADTPGAIERPQDLVGSAQPPLDALGEAAPSARDPRDAFEVSSAALTAPHTVDGARDPRQPFADYSPTLSPEGPPRGSPLPGPPPSGSIQNYPPPQAPVAQPQQGPAPYPQGHPPQRGPIAYQGPQRAAVEPAQRRLAQIAGALGLAGFLFGFAAPFLLIAAGVLGVRTSRLSGAAGWLAISTGVTFLLWQWITQTLGEGNLLAGLASLIYAFVFFISAAKRV
ncbi:MAG: hypothetical protein KDB41_00905 [Propionibacteriaceae bacterium]|jgi:hypothetical protein|nr:hypothetical protein [Propionibacteriaceae bacterium]HOA27360.1 hypothetical protein [Arachnia sp.]